MKRFIQTLLVALGLSSGCSKSGVVTPAVFTREFAETLRQANPGITVAVVADLELKVTSAEGKDSTSFLNNACDSYKQAPDAKADIIQKFVTAELDIIGDQQVAVDRDRIIPVIKDRPWLEETRQALVGRGAKEVPEYVYEDFNSSLVIVYAEDSPKNIRYLTPDRLDAAKVPRSELRQLACENLKRILPKIERQGTNGLYMITAGGDYEASLLLFDSVWSDVQKDVEGEIVVAIPTRDLLLVTGSKSPEGLAALKQMVKKASSEGAYRLTSNLFVYHNGKFADFHDGD